MATTERRLVTTREAAAILTMSAKTVSRWREKGAIPYVRVGPYNRVRFELAEVYRHLRPSDAD